MAPRLINMRFVATGLFVLAAVAALATFQYRAAADYQSLIEVRALVGDVYTDMLTLRRNEKDFLARKDLSYRHTFLDNFEQAMERLRVLQSKLRSNRIDDSKLNTLSELFETYKEKFITLSSLLEQIGFSHEEGLYGSMRSAIHRAEELLTAHQQQQLTKDMLMLRRWEKDFMLRMDDAYLEEFDREMEVMQEDLSRARLYPSTRTQIANALVAYEKDFKALAAAVRETGYSSDQGVHGEMRETIHQAERILEDLRQQSLGMINTAGAYIITQIAAFAAVLILSIFVVVFLLRRRQA